MHHYGGYYDGYCRADRGGVKSFKRQFARGKTVKIVKKAEQKLGFRSKVSFQQGMQELFEWSRRESSKDDFEKATTELEEKGLL